MATAKASQDFVPIKEIRNGVVILKDGGMRAVLLASSLNLSLKSAEEQRATILQFQAFLNSVDFPIQIIIRSRRYDIRPYLATLENRLGEIEEPLLKIQTREYITFIRDFTKTVSIMTKNFFIVVPYTSADIGGGAGPLAGLARILPFGKKETTEAREEAAFEEKQTQLLQRSGVITQGLARVGVRTAQLGTEELIELFFKTFNPGEITGIKFEQ